MKTSTLIIIALAIAVSLLGLVSYKSVKSQKADDANWKSMVNIINKLEMSTNVNGKIIAKLCAGLNVKPKYDSKTKKVSLTKIKPSTPKLPKVSVAKKNVKEAPEVKTVK